MCNIVFPLCSLPAMITSSKQFLLILMLVVCLVVIVYAKKDDDRKEKPTWAKKKLTDYTDADMERLLDQWNVRITLIS